MENEEHLSTVESEGGDSGYSDWAGFLQKLDNAKTNMEGQKSSLIEQLSIGFSSMMITADLVC